MNTPTLSVNDEDIVFFRTNGYLVIEAITTSEEVKMLRTVYDSLFAVQAGRAEGNQYDLAGKLRFIGRAAVRWKELMVFPISWDGEFAPVEWGQSTGDPAS